MLWLETRGCCKTADILDDQSVLEAPLLDALIRDYWFTGSSQLDSYRPPGNKEIMFWDVWQAERLLQLDKPQAENRYWSL